MSAIAVVTTLLYLPRQTRHTRLSVESAANLGKADAHSRFRVALMTNPDLAELLAKANRQDEIADGERIQLQMLFDEIFIDYAIGIITQTNGNTLRTDVQL